MDDTAASLQQDFDQAVSKYGPDSIEALDAERAARNYFQRNES